jgi:hypothetical protein
LSFFTRWDSRKTEGFVNWSRRLSSKNWRILAGAFVLLGFASCKVDVAKMREEQDKRIDTEGRDKVRADYFGRYKAHPDDPAITYLYARTLEEPSEEKPIVEQLVAKHPEFPWGHLALRAVLVELGQFERAAEESAKAAKLDPTQAVFSDAFKEDKDVVTLKAAEHAATFMKVGEKVEKTAAGSATADGNAGLASLVVAQAMYKKFDFIKSEFPAPPTAWHDTELLASVQETKQDGQPRTLVLLHVKNTDKEDVVLAGSDAKQRNAVACYTLSGKRVESTPGQFWQGQAEKDSCRTCDNFDIRIPPNESRTIDAIFDTGRAGLSRCVFFNVPSKRAKVVVEFAAGQ